MTLAEHEAAYREALAAGRLTFQRCALCHAWLPAREHCPSCLADAAERVDAGGAATLVSWVVYRRSFDPTTADRLPYNVALVELAEGPRLLANLLIDGEIGEPPELPAGTPLRLRVERDGEVAVPRFELLAP